MDEEKKILKSILVSSPERLQVHQLNEYYKKFVGKNIPFYEHGYKNLLEYLHSLSDFLIVKGTDLYSPVELKFPVVCQRLKKKKKKKRKKSYLRTDNKDTFNKNQEEAFHDISHTVNFSTNLGPSGMKTSVHIDHKLEKIPSLMSVDTGKIAAIRQGVGINQICQINEKQFDSEKKERKELRYPKTAIISEKNDIKLDKNPFQTSQAGASSSVHFETNAIFRREINTSTILEYRMTRGYISNGLSHIPSMKKRSSSIENNDLIFFSEELEKLEIKEVRNNELSNQLIPSLIPAGSRTLLSIMDEPIPPSLPEVSPLFARPKSDDLIDFDSAVRIPVPSKAVRPLLFAEVMRLAKLLEADKLNVCSWKRSRCKNMDPQKYKVSRCTE